MTLVEITTIDRRQVLSLTIERLPPGFLITAFVGEADHVSDGSFRRDADDDSNEKTTA